MREQRKLLVRVELVQQQREWRSAPLHGQWRVLQEGSLDSEEQFRQLVQQLVSELERLLPLWLVPSHSVTRSVKD